jgi:hypothetical protein
MMQGRPRAWARAAGYQQMTASTEGRACVHARSRVTRLSVTLEHFSVMYDAAGA